MAQAYNFDLIQDVWVDPDVPETKPEVPQGGRMNPLHLIRRRIAKLQLASYARQCFNEFNPRRMNW